MESRRPGFAGEYLWELDIARTQLLALARHVPAEAYSWRPAAGARTFSAVLVHIAAVNSALLGLSGDPTSDPGALLAKVREFLARESTITEKDSVIEFLSRSFDDVRETFAAADLEKRGDFFGEPTTLRRLYLRILAHSHEHMGQAIAYARTYGLRVPWPDPLAELQVKS